LVGWGFSHTGTLVLYNAGDSQFVDSSSLHSKGYDNSGANDEEVPSDQEYSDDEAEAERAEQAARDMDDENFTECCQANEAQAEVAEAEAEAAAAAAAGEYARMAASATVMDL
jgi:hypothetical protein